MFGRRLYERLGCLLLRGLVFDEETFISLRWLIGGFITARSLEALQSLDGNFILLECDESLLKFILELSLLELVVCISQSRRKWRKVIFLGWSIRVSTLSLRLVRIRRDFNLVLLQILLLFFAKLLQLDLLFQELSVFLLLLLTDFGSHNFVLLSDEGIHELRFLLN